MGLPWKKSEVDVIDVAIMGGAVYLAWLWWHRGPPGFGAGLNLLHAGYGGQGSTPIVLRESKDLDTFYNFRELTPSGSGSVGSQKLRSAAPQAIAGRGANGYGIEPADALALAAVQAYAQAKAAGTLPV